MTGNVSPAAGIGTAGVASPMINAKPAMHTAQHSFSRGVFGNCLPQSAWSALGIIVAEQSALLSYGTATRALLRSP